METRIERNRKRKKYKKRAFFKFFLLILCLSFFVFGLMVTEDSIQELTCVESQRMFSLGLKESGLHMQLFGKNYVLDFMGFVKNIIKIIK